MGSEGSSIPGAYTDTGMIRKYARVAEDIGDELAGLRKALDDARLPASFWPTPSALDAWNREANLRDPLMGGYERAKDAGLVSTGHPIRDALIELGEAYDQAHASVVGRLTGYASIYRVIAHNLRTAADNYDQAES